MPITHEGAEYFSKAELEDKIKDRVRNTQTELETLTTWKKQVEPELARVTTLATEVETWKGKATQVETRYTAATQFGITDTDTLEALEEAHKKAMGKVADPAARVDLGTYLGQVKSDPTLLPSYLRGVFSQGGGGQQGGGQQGAGQQGGAGGEQGGGQGGGQQGGGQGGTGTNRPAWASSSQNQQRVEPGTTPDFASKVQGAKTLDELVRLDAERRAARRG
jgi:hypothetical protein